MLQLMIEDVKKFVGVTVGIITLRKDSGKCEAFTGMLFS
jgi:hypothetical protein